MCSTLTVRLDAYPIIPIDPRELGGLIHIDHHQGVAFIANDLTPEEITSLVREAERVCARSRFASASRLRALPPGWAWVSGCYLLKLAARPRTPKSRARRLSLKVAVAA